MVFYHYGIRYFPAISVGQHGLLFERGYLAVDLFFILSGYVLSYVYNWKYFCQTGSTAQFLGARVARLYPLHVLILFLFFMEGLVFRYRLAEIPFVGPQSLTAFLANLLMLQGVQASELSWNYPTWSISVEFFAYLLFPLAIGIIAKSEPWLRALLGGYLMLQLYWLHVWSEGDFNQWNGLSAFARCLPEFVIGMLLYVITHHRQSTVLGSPVFLPVLVSGVLLGIQFGLRDYFIILLFGCLVPALVKTTGPMQSLLSFRPLVALGEISYSLYLIHGLVQQSVTDSLSLAGVADDSLSSKFSILLMLSLIIASIILALLSHKFFEMPVRRLLRGYLAGFSKMAPAEPPSLSCASHSLRANATYPDCRFLGIRKRTAD